jgi:hypothetical protein
MKSRIAPIDPSSPERIGVAPPSAALLINFCWIGMTFSGSGAIGTARAL